MLGLNLGLWMAAMGGDGSAPDSILMESGEHLLLEAGGNVLKNSSIPAQSSAGAITGAEYVAIVQGGSTRKVSLDALTTYARSI